MKKEKDTYNISRAKILAYVLSTFSRLENEIPDTKHVWKRYIGINKEEIPSGSLVCPILVDNAKEWYLGWYIGKDTDGSHLVESIETRLVCKFTNCGFYYIEPEFFDECPQYKYSDRQFDLQTQIKTKYYNVCEYGFRIGWTSFHPDGSLTVKCRKLFKDDWVEKKYKSIRGINRKSIERHFDEVQKKDGAQPFTISKRRLKQTMIK